MTSHISRSAPSRFQLAASSPSTRNVRHLALPPDLMNSENPSGRTSNPAASEIRPPRPERPRFRITVLPTTTALQLKEIASSAATSINSGNPVAQDRQPVGVKRAGIIKGKVRRERAKAGIEMIKPRVDELERKHFLADPARRSTGGCARRCENDSRRSRSRRRKGHRRRPRN